MRAIFLCLLACCHVLTERLLTLLTYEKPSPSLISKREMRLQRGILSSSRTACLGACDPSDASPNETAASTWYRNGRLCMVGTPALIALRY